jgi:hypothetical protein
MNNPSRILSLAICGLALAACTVERPQTAAGPNYQAPVVAVAPPANLKSICFAEADLLAFRARMVQQELAVGVLQCKGSDGVRQYDAQYRAFVAKFNPELASNAQDLKSIVSRKGRNFDVVITEIANRTAQRPTQDAAFCSRHLRALEWSLAPSVTSLSQVPSPYDFGPEMNVFPCPTT